MLREIAHFYLPTTAAQLARSVFGALYQPPPSLFALPSAGQGVPSMHSIIVTSSRLVLVALINVLATILSLIVRSLSLHSLDSFLCLCARVDR